MTAVQLGQNGENYWFLRAKFIEILHISSLFSWEKKSRLEKILHFKKINYRSYTNTFYKYSNKFNAVFFLFLK